MVTLSNALKNKGYSYPSNLGTRAEDINFNSTIELCCALGFIVKHCRKLDAEIPDNSYNTQQIQPNYPIHDGVTSGGNPMKYGTQLRIYFDTTNNMPVELSSRLQNDTQMRITGSLFVEACLQLGFKHGFQQDMVSITQKIKKIFNTPDEQSAFDAGYNL